MNRMVASFLSPQRRLRCSPVCRSCDRILDMVGEKVAPILVTP